MTKGVKTRPGFVPGLALMVALALAGCGRKNANDKFSQLSFPAKSSNVGSQFGEQVEQAARADPNAEPMNVIDGNLPPVDPTQEPVDVR